VNRILHIPFWLLAFSIMTILTLPLLIQDGMFMDAVIYSGISHNLSQGIGSFWFPQFSARNLAIGGVYGFLEQPPLGYWIQSLFFKIFGSSMYVERFYTFLTMCISAVLINSLWRNIYKTNKEIKHLGWLPIVLWITIPVCFWSFSNNMLENTMGIFILAAVLFCYKACVGNAVLINSVLAGVFLFFASLTKGIPGLFPLAIPLLYWIIFKNISFITSIKSTAFMLLCPVVIYFVLFLYPESRESLSQYLFKRALQRIDAAPNVGSHFYILFRLISELLPAIIIIAVIKTINYFKKTKTNHSVDFKLSAFFIMVGLCGALPLMLTRVQKGFYFVQALPFFAIGFAVLIAPVINNWINSLSQKRKSLQIFFYSNIIVIILVFVYSFLQIGKTGRNQELLQDVYAVGKIVPHHTTISVPDFDTWNQWDLQAYLIRYFNISLDDKTDNVYMLVDKNTSSNPPVDHEQVPIKTKRFILFKKMI